MSSFVQSISAIGVHGRFDIDQQFNPGVNILFGRNGTGKTTLLHIIANILTGDYQRFAFLTFNRITLRLDDGFSVSIYTDQVKSKRRINISINGDKKADFLAEEIQKTEKTPPEAIRRQILEELRSFRPPLSVDYFPAFRNMIEAWSSFRDEADIVRNRHVGAAYDPITGRRYSGVSPASATRFARDLFGPFVPRINYPSPIEIEDRLMTEIQQALINVGNTDRKLLSQAFRDIYTALSQASSSSTINLESTLEQIRSLSQRLKDSSLSIQPESVIVDEELRRLFYSAGFRGDKNNLAAPILDVYRQALEELVRVQEKSFENIKRYLDSVNGFLEGKSLDIQARDTSNRNSLVSIVFDDGSLGDLRSLSSGERQIVALIYAATHMRTQEVVLIDEPEISLHIDWQRKLLPSMAEQLVGRQIIACTHSPVIGADYEERTIDLQFYPTARQMTMTELETGNDISEEEA